VYFASENRSNAHRENADNMKAVNYSDANLHDGKIVSFDRVNKKLNLLLDDQDDEDQYLMAYEAVCEYSNKEHSTFNQYQLPYHLLFL
jgi:hypothetical protein